MGSLSTGAIVFTDMVDSTALRSRLGDDRADQLRKDHDDLLRTVTEATVAPFSLDGRWRQGRLPYVVGCGFRRSCHPASGGRLLRIAALHRTV